MKSLLFETDAIIIINLIKTYPDYVVATNHFCFDTMDSKQKENTAEQYENQKIS